MITDSQVSIGTLPTSAESPPHVSAPEAEYAARFTNSAARERFEQRRWLVRQILATHLDVDPDDLTPAYQCPEHGEGVHGRPGYRLRGEHIPLAISASSYQGTVVVLVSGEFTRVGIDITDKYDGAFRTDREPLPDTAKTFLSFADAEWVLDAPMQERSERLARVWTIKEAVLKAEGSGLRRDPVSFSVVQDGELAETLSQHGIQDTYIERDTFGPIVTRNGLVISLAAQD
ncbi:4'-phosphopantetheinyl transferase family protein [Haematomicrobium sanguinis]|uniref:4'-phosphopantetheinyl transferase family protein n=1 Tax=Haematomicrobium sanguinis TaxID=479106 RepID=UPI00047ED073|nr:4'-phosphopantetheinyl transferase superfamily protein [Haematomicrobium sanguinis]